MLNINDIKNINITKTMMGGYKIEEVDELLSKVCDTLEKNEFQKAELTKKLKILGDRVEKYRNDEQAVKNALYEAQKKKIEIEEEAEYNARRIMDTTERKTEEVKVRLQKEIQNALGEAKSIKVNAKAEADKTIADAKLEAKHILEDAKKQCDEVYNEVERAKKDYIDLQNKIVLFRNELIEKYKSHLQVIVELPSSDSVKEVQKKLDIEYPTAGNDAMQSKIDETDAKVSNAKEEKPKKNNRSYQERYEAVENDFDEFIQRTLEFDTNEVKSAVQKLSNEQTGVHHNTDENMVNTQDIPDVNEDISASVGTGSFAQKARVRVAPHPDKHGKINYTSRTIDESYDDEFDEDDGIKIIDDNIRLK